MLSQNNSDCNTAVSVCNAIYDEQDSPEGIGNVYESAPGSCQTGGEFNSAWYIFSPQSDGFLSFTLQPNDIDDDYDWSVFEITTGGCAGINTGASPEVSCNSYGETGGNQGPTGISSADGGFGNNNGPGNTNGPPFNADLSVTAGSVYALVVMNYSSTLNGYELDFNDSDVSIFDETAPAVESVVANWCTGEVTITFDEEIAMSEIDFGDFALDNPDYSIGSFDGGDPELSSVLTFGISPASIDEPVILNLTMAGGAVLADICGNEVAMPIQIDITGGFTFSTETTIGCNGTGASLDVNMGQNDVWPPYTVNVNGQVEGNFPLVDIDAGVYDIVITDGLGCARDTSLTIESEIATLTLPADTVLCSLEGSFTAIWSGDEIDWSPVTGAVINSPTSGTTALSSPIPGQFTFDVAVTSGDCIANESFDVTFNFPPQMTVETEDVTCFGGCDGELHVVNGNPAPITVTFSGNQDTGPDLTFDGLCAGQYAMEVVHSPECTVDYTFTINEPPQVVAEFEASSWIVPMSNPLVTLTSTSENADSLSWSVAYADTTMQMEDTLISSSEIWELMLPFQAGIFEIQLMASDTAGCASYFRGFIEVRDEFRFYIPNSFSPNEDGLNDVFYVNFTYPPVKFDFMVFNRWGDVVFKAKDYKDVWMGDKLQGDYQDNEHYKGSYYCEPGVYIWQLTTRGVERDEKTYRGTVTLLR